MSSVKHYLNSVLPEGRKARWLKLDYSRGEAVALIEIEGEADIEMTVDYSRDEMTAEYVCGVIVEALELFESET